MRVVLDTNILVRANPIVSPQGVARDLLLTIVSGPDVLVLSTFILTEVERVMSYPRVRARWPLEQETIEQYLAFLETAGTLADIPAVSPAIVSDPDDDPILQTAIVGRADVLCTRDEAFRDEVVEHVCKAHSLRVLDDIALLQELRESRKSDVKK